MHWQYACSMIENKESRPRLKCTDCQIVVDLSTKHRKYRWFNEKAAQRRMPQMLSSPVLRSPPAASTTRLPAHATQGSEAESRFPQMQPEFEPAVRRQAPEERLSFWEMTFFANDGFVILTNVYVAREDTLVSLYLVFRAFH